jgi:hypothetical protein
MLLYSLLILFLGSTLACHPECRWQCSDPVCPAICAPICEAPVCQICVNRTSLVCANTRYCFIQYPTLDDACEADSCPIVEVICPNLCYGLDNCTVLCSQPMCSWQCSKPTNCPHPVCELQCEHPACEYTSSAISSIRTSFILILSLCLLFF